jgi:signal transduction histidine kinase
MIYHDLRSPLANIISSLEIMQETLPSSQPKQVKQLFDIAERSTSHMQRLISSLLDIDRLEAGQGIARRNRVQVETLINDSIEAVLPLAHNKEINIEKLVPQSIPPLFIDEDMIRRVLINLVENACKFSPQKGKISVGAKLNGEFITMWVDDQGPGIPEESRERIFEKFSRLDEKSPVKGLGLGLAFCRIASQAHGGKIWVENLPRGGSRFLCQLPAAMDTDPKN